MRTVTVQLRADNVIGAHAAASLSVPAQDSLGLNMDQRFAPSRPISGKDGPEQSIPRTEPRMSRP
jgi:hypothetical protein